MSEEREPLMKSVIGIVRVALAFWGRTVGSGG